MKVGVLGGVFNPPHIGHLIAAQEAHAQLGLDAVVWIPAGEPPHRQVEQDPGAAVRAEMCAAAISADPRFKLSRMELDTPGPSFTVDTLRELAAGGDELWLLLGGDQAGALPRWHRPAEVLDLARLAVLDRQGADRHGVEEAIATVAPDRTPPARFLDMPLIGISSTLVRRRVAAGQPFRYLVPDPVADLITERRLYGSPVSAA